MKLPETIECAIAFGRSTGWIRDNLGCDGAP